MARRRAVGFNYVWNLALIKFDRTNPPRVCYRVRSDAYETGYIRREYTVQRIRAGDEGRVGGGKEGAGGWSRKPRA